MTAPGISVLEGDTIESVRAVGNLSALRGAMLGGDADTGARGGGGAPAARHRASATRAGRRTAA